MAALLIGYARCSTDQQDLTAQHDGRALGVCPARIYVDHGLTGTNRDRPGLREAPAACREGDTLVVTKLNRLARSLPDARAIADELTARQVRLNLGGSVYDPNDAVGRLLFNVLAMVAEFESDLIRLRTGARLPLVQLRLPAPQLPAVPGQARHQLGIRYDPRAGLHRSGIRQRDGDLHEPQPHRAVRPARPDLSCGHLEVPARGRPRLRLLAPQRHPWGPATTAPTASPRPTV